MKPICPICRLNGQKRSYLDIHAVYAEGDDAVNEGILICSDPHCRSEYPIIDGIPIILADLRAYMGQQLLSILGRRDLSHDLVSLIGDCCGQGSDFETQRRNLSIYGYDHYGDLDPGAPDPHPFEPGSVARLLRKGMETVGEAVAGPVIDIGCAVGRTTFELADGLDTLVLGIDLNFNMLKAAKAVLDEGRVSFPLKRVGIAYDLKQYPVRFNHHERVDFWACDATNLPFSDTAFGLGICLNLLDCVKAPYDLLKEVARVIKPGARAIISSPYDWNVSATPAELWIGGHSQRSESAGSSATLLRSLLTAGQHPNAIDDLEILTEIEDGRWNLYLHERSMVTYRGHLLVVGKQLSKNHPD